MTIRLDPVEVRILACLIEKESTTPEYYPLTLNALTSACNQKSNREPVVSLEEKTVVRGIESLREKGLVLMVTGAGSRVPKYKHIFARRFQLNAPEVAALCLLMLRGPQTVGELRGRTARLHAFADLSEVDSTLNGLMSRGEGAYVVKLPRQPGRKEARYAHLFCGEPEMSEPEQDVHSVPAPREAPADNERMRQLEEKIAHVRAELGELREAFAEFKKQFE